MKLAIMQPYFFPYLGYFQLISAVDIFVLHDDVQFIKGGWINRNRILLNNKSFNIGIPLQKDSFTKKINERIFVSNSDIYKIKLLRQIENAYKKAPLFEEVFPFISELIINKLNNVSEFNALTLSEICKRLKISTKFYNSSELTKQNSLTAEDRVLEINQVIGSDVYINPIGGSDLYNRETFHERNIDLRFFRTNKYTYQQFDGDFITDLSIIDILMFNSIEKIIQHLAQYQIQ